jgi:hypothetical protein
MHLRLGAHVTTTASPSFGGVLLVRSLGADQIIDYSQERFERLSVTLTARSIWLAVTRSSARSCTEAWRDRCLDRWDAGAENGSKGPRSRS